MDPVELRRLRLQRLDAAAAQAAAVQSAAMLNAAMQGAATAAQNAVTTVENAAMQGGATAVGNTATAVGMGNGTLQNTGPSTVRSSALEPSNAAVQMQAVAQFFANTGTAQPAANQNPFFVCLTDNQLGQLINMISGRNRHNNATNVREIQQTNPENQPQAADQNNDLPPLDEDIFILDTPAPGPFKGLSPRSSPVRQKSPSPPARSRGSSPQTGPSRKEMSPSPEAGPSKRWRSPSPHATLSRRWRSPSPQAGPSKRWRSPSPPAGPSRKWRSPSPQPDPFKKWRSPSPQPGPSRKSPSPHPGSSRRRSPSPVPSSLRSPKDSGSSSSQWLLSLSKGSKSPTRVKSSYKHENTSTKSTVPAWRRPAAQSKCQNLKSSFNLDDDDVFLMSDEEEAQPPKKRGRPKGSKNKTHSKAATSEKKETERYECRICHEPENLQVTTCGHLFHKTCLTSWFTISKQTSKAQKKCPACQKFFENSFPFYP